MPLMRLVCIPSVPNAPSRKQGMFESTALTIRIGHVGDHDADGERRLIGPAAQGEQAIGGEIGIAETDNCSSPAASWMRSTSGASWSTAGHVRRLERRVGGAGPGGRRRHVHQVHGEVDHVAGLAKAVCQEELMDARANRHDRRRTASSGPVFPWRRAWPGTTARACFHARPASRGNSPGHWRL